MMSIIKRLDFGLNFGLDDRGLGIARPGHTQWDRDHGL